MLGVIEGEGGAGGSGNSETGHERLAAMMAGADGDSHLVDQCSKIVMMDAFDGERDRADPIGWAVEMDAGDFGKR